ncbi:MAG: twin-arginine translocase TatA/TatE family subunit [Candidatus Marinimicrobia bacterium]|jgi:sec-independent protein translocase protein TatA|nr:twin-arginine translocase TatA/TatE family subunit [Candidatus Neomarinimicrobiota bacterium]MDP6853676.1 twin-arginine translocase TatA/TatE family subunit [Candidatus Neomarinimicrobiota bacterium]MDP6937028.1 twin-arginine translocase TatA/TatE family subunit [Candidatus Neomarinimicrobiota bacterium]
MNFGPWEAILILVIIILLFGGRKIPELAKGLGRSIREFSTSVKSEEE